MNKLIKMATMVVCAVTMSCIVGCGGGSPDSVAKNVVSCLKDADMEGISEYSTGEFKQAVLMYKGMMDGAPKEEVEEMKEKCGSSKYEIGAAVINGDKATVPVKIDGKDVPIKLIKVDGSWKVEDFNFKQV